jgi:hypothetical protein
MKRFGGRSNDYDDIAAQRAAAAAPGRRQDFLIPRAGIQLLRSRAGSVSTYACVGGIALRGRRLDGPEKKRSGGPRRTSPTLMAGASKVEIIP